MICAKCGSTVNAGELFCGECGAKIMAPPVSRGANVCAKCGNILQEGELFCGECGTRVTAAPVSGGANVCAKCGNILQEGEMFCGECGTPVGSRASGAEFKPARPKPAAAAYFCENCGTRLGSASEPCPVCSARIRKDSGARMTSDAVSGTIKATMRDSSSVTAEDEEAGSFYFRRPRDI